MRNLINKNYLLAFLGASALVEIILFFFNIPEITKTAPSLLIISNIILAFAAVASAILAWKNTEAVKDATQASLLAEFKNEYHSKEMSKHLDNLSDWIKVHPKIMDPCPRFSKIWPGVDHIADREKVKELLNGKEIPDNLDDSRRFVKLYFLKAVDLYKIKNVNEKFMQSICDAAGVQLLFQIVEPLEYVKDPNNYEIYTKKKFKTLLTLIENKFEPSKK